MTDYTTNALARRGIVRDAVARMAETKDLRAQLVYLATDLAATGWSVPVVVASDMPGVTLSWEPSHHWTTRWALRLATPFPHTEVLPPRADDERLALEVTPLGQRSVDPDESIAGRWSLAPLMADLIPALLDRMADVLRNTERSRAAISLREPKPAEPTP